MQVEVSGGIRDDRSLEAALESGAARINLGTAALENPEWAADVIGRYGDVDRGRARRARHDPRRARLDAGGRRPVDRARPPRGGRLQPLRRDRRHEGRNAAGARTSTCCARSPRARPSPSSPRAASRAWTTSRRCATSCRSASKARSSARRSTRVPSRSPRRWMSPDTDPHDSTPAARLGGRALGGAPLRAQPARGRRRLGRPGLLAALTAFRAGSADQVAVIEAYRTARLLIPLVAEKGDGTGVGAARPDASTRRRSCRSSRSPRPTAGACCRSSRRSPR